ncbi:hydroxymethylpyrimidine/phosphomethylpyrimidine kinase [Thalassobacillus devorans]|uniref:Hydroxymethylpyrimidine/phosphomethylpyrimidine kinase n=1 Tax=Thalassobacillus devorans TaxID=279813 RepID=A0ABQ1PFM9_9BACI|nr:bifunctional hydroxymethylpyrimidine kinase/phosphomethylpyrimidine kinase [Thalassobacillus devorans]NIK29378.1 hydroxymethylpyrimidine/phosphomethylpyrimidine kinase [Thalassobacillus devorans]GGC96202.1 hydroxymethylpyrimidine/phosphomethylpyrimidine kinase [Thalassobacillus devorans]
MSNVIPCALTIAGSDSSGGAGIQADLKTFQELKCYGMSVLTSVTAQNTTGVQGVHHLPGGMIKQQIDSIYTDIRVDAVKTGMIANIEMMEVIAEAIPGFQAPYVMDPVMVATSGDPLIEPEARDYLCQQLIPMTTVVTPNIAEAAFITKEKIETVADMKEAAKHMVHGFGAGAALIKGGHLQEAAIDVMYDGNKVYTFETDRIPTKNTHGTGCTYSAAITAYLSQGLPLVSAVERSKHYITAAIRHAFDIGEGNGPTNHWAIREEVRQ